MVALHACLEHGVKTNCSFAAAFGGVIPGLRVPPTGLGQEKEREKAIVVSWLKRAIVQGQSSPCVPVQFSFSVVTTLFLQANSSSFLKVSIATGLIDSTPPTPRTLCFETPRPCCCSLAR